MKDIYLYEDAPVLKNLLNIKDEKLLEIAESDITYIKLLDIDSHFTDDRFDYIRLKKIHKIIFEDIYKWAGEERIINITKGERVLGGDTIRYSDVNNIEEDVNVVISKLNNIKWSSIGIQETAESFAKLIASLWQIHPFREGNTRTIITFATQFSKVHGFSMSKTLLRENSEYVRDALVKASDGQYSEYHYLTNIFKDAIENG